MKCMMWTAILIVLGATLVGGAVTRNGDTAIDLSAFHAAKKPTVVVHAISVQRMMRVKLTKERFDPYVATNDADYVLTIQDPHRSRKIAQLIDQLELEVVPDDAPGVGVRYRVRFLDDHTLLRTLYVSPCGAIVDDTRVLRPAGNSAWIRELWEELQRDLVK